MAEKSDSLTADGFDWDAALRTPEIMGSQEMTDALAQATAEAATDPSSPVDPALAELAAPQEPAPNALQATGAFDAPRTLGDPLAAPDERLARVAEQYGIERPDISPPPEPGVFGADTGLERPVHPFATAEVPERTPEMQKEVEFGDEYARQASLTEDQRFSEEYDRQKEFADTRAAALEADRTEAANNLKDLQSDMEYAERKAAADAAEAKELGAQGVDRGRFWKSRSTGQKIAAYISVALSGWLNPGGRNQSLEMMMRAIDSDVADQLADIENAEDALAVERGIAVERGRRRLEEYTLKEKARLVGLEGLDAKILEDMNRLNPAGTRARGLLQFQAQVAAAKAAEVERIKEKNFKRASAERADKRKVQEIEQRNKASARTAYTARRAQDIGREEAKLGREVEASKLERAQLKEGERQRRHLAVGSLIQEDGTPYYAETATQRDAYADTVSSATLMLGLLDKLIHNREKHGWSSDVVKGKVNRVMKGDFAAYALQAKEVAKLGVLTGPDVGLIHDQAGTGDPTEWRDPLPGLENARDNLIVEMNQKLRDKGYTGPRWEPDKPPAIRREKEETFQKAEKGELAATYATGSHAELTDDYNTGLMSHVEAGRPLNTPTFDEFSPDPEADKGAQEQYIDLLKAAEKPASFDVWRDATGAAPYETTATLAPSYNKYVAEFPTPDKSIDDVLAEYPEFAEWRDNLAEEVKDKVGAQEKRNALPESARVRGY